MLGRYCGISDLKTVRISLWKPDNPISEADKFWKQFGQFVKIKSMQERLSGFL